VCIAALPAVAPRSPYSFSTYDDAVRNEPSVPGLIEQPDRLNEASARIGHHTSVLYLAYGSIIYRMGNPATCRYPSPQWIQRGAFVRSIRTAASYADNFACLQHDQAAKYLVWQTDWFPMWLVAPQIKRIIYQQWNCSPGTRIQVSPTIVICPRSRSRIPRN